MTDQFVAEIRIFPFNFAPTGWATCDGQLLPISQNTALFSLLGTFYGGDGKSTFALPNLQDSVPINQGQGPGLSDRFLGELGGTPSVTLLTTEMPVHSHSLNAASGATDEEGQKNPQGAAPGQMANTARIYGSLNANQTTMNPNAVAPTGSSLPHNNLMPYLTLSFCIALQGIFPPRS